VVLSDVDKEKICLVNKGVPPFYEPKLEEMLRCALDDNRLKAVNNTEDAVFETGMTFICVGTPSKSSGEEPALNQPMNTLVYFFPLRCCGDFLLKPLKKSQYYYPNLHQQKCERQGT